MSLDKPIQRIAIVGTGVIGASWAALYLARGFSVVATNPTPSAERRVMVCFSSSQKECSQLFARRAGAFCL